MEVYFYQCQNDSLDIYNKLNYGYILGLPNPFSKNLSPTCSRRGDMLGIDFLSVIRGNILLRGNFPSGIRKSILSFQKTDMIAQVMCILDRVMK